MQPLESLLSKLIAFESITPDDKHCQAFMIQYLEQLGFNCIRLDNQPVSNFFASFGHQGPLLVFAGHTDVVPVGNAAQWTTPPFHLSIQGDLAFGRGVADMKGSLASMLMMAARWVNTHHEFPGRIGFLITSGEEGDDFNLGTPYVMEQLKNRGIHIDYCVVGEPSSTKTVGDTIKIGRRGSLTAKIHLQGRQGHVAYPHLADNPIHRLSPALAELTAKIWDNGNSWFPPTSMQITALHSGGHASNIIPGELSLNLNFRFSTEQTSEGLKQKLTSVFKQHHLNTEIEWTLNGQPFLTHKGLLLEAALMAIKQETGLQTELSTSGGTSDGRFIAPYGVEVVEIGPVNASIHQVNEQVSLSELMTLEKIYFTLAEKIFSKCS